MTTRQPGTAIGYDLAKRGLDVAAGSLGLLIGLPLLAGVAAGVWRSLGRPVLFRQERAGRHGVPFTLYKFRTMTGSTAPLHPFAAWLRRTGLDELPQLVNILRGEMSFVGPRPLYLRYLPYYTAEEAERHAVRPGLTGWAQIHGRHRLGWDERLAMDVWYVRHRSWRLDLRILAGTLRLLVRREAEDGVPQPDLDVTRAGKGVEG